MKKICVFLLIIFMMNFILVPISYAVAPAVPLVVGGTSLGVALVKGLIAAGVTYGSGQVGEYLAEDVWDSFSQTTKEEWAFAMQNMVNGTVAITNHMWESLKSYVDAVINPGANNLGYLPISESITGGSTPLLGPWYDQLWLTYSGTQWRYKVESASDRHYLKVSSNGTTWSTAYTLYKNNIYGNSVGLYLSKDAAPSNYYRVRMVHESLAVPGTYVEQWAQSFTTAPQAATGIGELSLDVTGSNVVDDPGRDFSNSATGQRMLGIPWPSIDAGTYPGIIDGMSGDTLSDIEAEALGLAIPVPETGTLQGIINSVVSLYTAITGAISTFFDLTVPINLEPFKVTGSVFTTVFPFSLPWDLLNSFTILNNPPGDAPVIPISVDTPLADWDFEINFDMFAGIIGIIRVIELFLFDISLIFVTYKLVGGDR